MHALMLESSEHSTVFRRQFYSNTPARKIGLNKHRATAQHHLQSR